MSDFPRQFRLFAVIGWALLLMPSIAFCQDAASCGRAERFVTPAGWTSAHIEFSVGDVPAICRAGPDGRLQTRTNRERVRAQLHGLNEASSRFWGQHFGPGAPPEGCDNNWMMSDPQSQRFQRASGDLLRALSEISDTGETALVNCSRIESLASEFDSCLRELEFSAVSRCRACARTVANAEAARLAAEERRRQEAERQRQLAERQEAEERQRQEQQRREADRRRQEELRQQQVQQQEQRRVAEQQERQRRAADERRRAEESRRLREARERDFDADAQRRTTEQQQRETAARERQSSTNASIFDLVARLFSADRGSDSHFRGSSWRYSIAFGAGLGLAPVVGRNENTNSSATGAQSRSSSSYSGSAFALGLSLDTAFYPIESRFFGLGIVANGFIGAMTSGSLMGQGGGGIRLHAGHPYFSVIAEATVGWRFATSSSDSYTSSSSTHTSTDTKTSGGGGRSYLNLAAGIRLCPSLEDEFCEWNIDLAFVTEQTGVEWGPNPIGGRISIGRLGVGSITATALLSYPAYGQPHYAANADSLAGPFIAVSLVKSFDFFGDAYGRRAAREPDPDATGRESGSGTSDAPATEVAATTPPPVEPPAEPAPATVAPVTAPPPEPTEPPAPAPVSTSPPAPSEPPVTAPPSPIEPAASAAPVEPSPAVESAPEPVEPDPSADDSTERHHHRRGHHSGRHHGGSHHSGRHHGGRHR